MCNDDWHFWLPSSPENAQAHLGTYLDYFLRANHADLVALLLAKGVSFSKETAESRNELSLFVRNALQLLSTGQLSLEGRGTWANAVLEPAPPSPQMRGVVPPQGIWTQRLKQVKCWRC